MWLLLTQDFMGKYVHLHSDRLCIFHRHETSMGSTYKYVHSRHPSGSSSSVKVRPILTILNSAAWTRQSRACSPYKSSLKNTSEFLDGGDCIIDLWERSLFCRVYPRQRLVVLSCLLRIWEQVPWFPKGAKSPTSSTCFARPFPLFSRLMDSSTYQRARACFPPVFAVHFLMWSRNGTKALPNKKYSLFT